MYMNDLWPRTCIMRMAVTAPLMVAHEVQNRSCSSTIGRSAERITAGLWRQRISSHLANKQAEGPLANSQTKMVGLSPPEG